MSVRNHLRFVWTRLYHINQRFMLTSLSRLTSITRYKRQADGETGTLAQNTLNADDATHRLRKLFHNRQPQAGATAKLLARIFCTVKPLPDVGQFVLRNTLASILDLEHHSI